MRSRPRLLARLSRRPRVAAIAFGVCSAVHLVAQAVDADGVADVTQAALMPLLGAATASAWADRRPGHSPAPRLLTLTLVGLGFSWLGDLLPRFGSAHSFLIMVGMFGVAQASYAIGFAPMRPHGARLLLTAGAYAAIGAGIVGLCAPHAGALLPALVVYAALIAAMATLGSGVNAQVAVGATVFVLSDALIALGAFVPGWDLPQHDLAVMSTYIAAQTLIALGVLRRLDPEG